MDYYSLITLLIILAAMLLFASERFPVDQVAVGAMILFVLTGVLTPRQAVQGFSNPATITVAAMFILSRAVMNTGAIEALAPSMGRLFKAGENQVLLGMMPVVGGISAFINNTPVVATFIPMVTSSAKVAKIPASRFLMALSFGAIFGGSCTLIGTSTNLLVSGIAENNGYRPFRMFEMAPMGLVFFLLGTVYMLTAGKWLQSNSSKELGKARKEQNKRFLTSIQISNLPDGKQTTLKDLFGKSAVDAQFQLLRRGTRKIQKPSNDTALKEGDQMLVRVNVEGVKNLLRKKEVEVAHDLNQTNLPEKDMQLIEVVILPNSELAGRKLGTLDFAGHYKVNAVAIRHHGLQRFHNLGAVKLRPGDILLLEADTEGEKRLEESETSIEAPFLLLAKSRHKKPKLGEIAIVGAVITGAIALASLNIIDIMTATIAGCVILVSTRVLTMHDTYRAIDWQIIFLLAGALSLGTAMKASGLTDILSAFLISDIGQRWGPVALLSLLYLITTVITAVMSNNAAAALMAPLALNISEALAVSPTPLLIAVAFAASACFVSPIGYQTNAMIYSTGRFRFSDFIRVGGPLNLLFWLAGSLLIPVFYPF